MSTSGYGEEEILDWISKASQAFALLRGTWRSKNISEKTKILQCLKHSTVWQQNPGRPKPSAISSRSSRKSACAGLSIYTDPRQSQTMSYAEEQEQNQLHGKSGKRDDHGLVMCCACHQQQHHHELPLGGPL